eukprot:jgi/Antlo1/1382/1225
MEGLRSYTKTIEARGFPVEPEHVGEMLSTLNSFILKMPRIPPVLDIDKTYTGFHIVCMHLHTESKKIIMLDENISAALSNTIPVQLVLNYDYFTYKEILSMALPKSATAPASFQIVGNILHLNLKDEQLEFRKVIGAVLLDKIKGIETVIRKVGEVSSEFRCFEIEVLAGSGQLKTMHLENNLKFFIDYENVYWNSRLQEERRRLLKKFQRGDVIVDPFCGVGPLVVSALKKGCRVHCNDLNPVAIDCLRKNLAINHVDCTHLAVQCKDARDFLEALWGCQVDHVVLNLPGRSLEFIKHLRGCDKNALLHCYFFCREGIDPTDLIRSHANFSAGKYKILHLRNVSPRKRMYKVEAKLINVF